MYIAYLAACDDGQIRLVRGSQVDEASGALQVCFNQRWGVVQNYYDSINVVCYQLGFGGKYLHII